MNASDANDSNTDLTQPLNHQITRRNFISTVSAATAGILLGSCDKKENPTEPTKVIPEGASKVATAEISSYDPTSLRKALETMFTNLGGLSDIIKSGDKVGIKINCTGGAGSARSYQNQVHMPVGETYWTHPEVLRAVGQLVKDAGAGTIYVVEAIYDWDSINQFGYKPVIDALGAQFYDINQKDPYNAYVERPVGDKSLIYNSLTQNGILNDFDCFISLAKSKRHKGAGVTHGMKNLVGTLPVPCGKYNNGQGNRAAIHQHRKYEGNTDSNLCRVILDLNHATPIQLVVNDAIRTVLGSEGPWNRNEWALRPVALNRLIASKDPVAADAVATKVTGYNPMAADGQTPFPGHINYLKLATELGMGNHDLGMIEILGPGV